MSSTVNSKYGYEVMADSIYDFDKRLHQFWKLRLDDMVENREVYQYAKEEIRKMKEQNNK
jgi:hypothetical protein